MKRENALLQERKYDEVRRKRDDRMSGRLENHQDCTINSQKNIQTKKKGLKKERKNVRLSEPLTKTEKLA